MKTQIIKYGLPQLIVFPDNPSAAAPCGRAMRNKTALRAVLLAVAAAYVELQRQNTVLYPYGNIQSFNNTISTDQKQTKIRFESTLPQLETTGVAVGIEQTVTIHKYKHNITRKLNEYSIVLAS